MNKQNLTLFSFLVLFILSSSNVFAFSKPQNEYKRVSGVITDIQFNNIPHTENSTVSLTLKSNNDTLKVIYLGIVDPLPSWLSLGKNVCGIGRDFLKDMGVVVVTKLSEVCDEDLSIKLSKVPFKDVDSIDTDLKNWIDENKKKAGKYTTTIDGRSYLLISLGILDQNYSINIRDIKLTENNIYYVYYDSTLYTGKHNFSELYIPYSVVELVPSRKASVNNERLLDAF